MYQCLPNARLTGFLGLFLGVVACSLASFSPAQAVPVTFDYEGRVDFIEGIDDPSVNMLLGQHLRLTIMYESTTPDLLPTRPFIGEYNNAITGFTITVGETTLTGNTGDVFVLNDMPSGAVADSLVLNSQDSSIIGPFLGGQPVQGIGVVFNDSAGAALDSVALPTSQPDPSKFDFVKLSVFLGEGRSEFGPYRNALVAVNDIQSVPEPSTVWLLGTGFVGLAGWRYRTSMKQ